MCVGALRRSNPLAVSRTTGLLAALVTGAAAYLIVRAVLAADDSAESLPAMLEEARERAADEPHPPTDEAIGTLAELARVTEAV